MKQALGFLLLLCAGIRGLAQHSITALIKDASSKEPLAGASILLNNTTKGAHAGANGIVTLSDIPDGRQILSVHFVGYKDQELTLSIPRTNDTLTILLEPTGEEMDPVVITS